MDELLDSPSPSQNRFGKYFLYATGASAIGISIVCFSFVSPALRKHCLPYIPATPAQIRNIFKALEHRTGSLVDLGSGDGRIVLGMSFSFCLNSMPNLNISLLKLLSHPFHSLTRDDMLKSILLEAAQRNFNAHGIEINPWLVAYSKVRSLAVKNARFSRCNLWTHSLSEYDNVVIFGVECMMRDLEVKMMREINDECVIVACRFPLVNSIPFKTIGHGIDTVWVYKK